MAESSSSLRARGLATRVALCVAAALVYCAAAKLGLLLAFRHPSVSPVWPPSGVAIALVLHYGLRLWPGVFFGAFAANILFTPVSPLIALGIATGNTVEAVAAFLFLSLFAHGPDFLRRRRDFFRFLVLCAGFAPLFSAVIGTLVLCLGGAAQWRDLPVLLFTWWLGDAMGALVITPWILSWANPPRKQPSPAVMAESALCLFLLGLVTAQIFFGWPVHALSGRPNGAWIFPLLVWGAMRFGPRTVSSGILLLSVITILATLEHHGFFVLPTLNLALIFLQLFVGSVALAMQFLAVSVEENEDARQALRALAEDLKRSNEDLERFAHTASHDFQEPLRMIKTATQMIQRRDGEHLAPEGRRSLEMIAAAADRMRDLTRALLDFAKLGAAVETTDLVDTNVACANAKENLKQSIFESGAEIRCESLPIVAGKMALLTHIFQNLIGNAIKFRGEEPPRITVRAERQGHQWIFSVIDNGVGFDPDEAERIFIPLYRSPRRTPYPGNGIGLAACRKIIENHLGGRIWATSVPGKGSSFHFSVPDTIHATTESNAPRQPTL